MLDTAKITQEIATEECKEKQLYLPPPIYYSLYAAVRFAILLAYPQTHDWFYSNFIQLHYEEGRNNTDHRLNIFPIEYMKSYYYTGAALFLKEQFIDHTIMDINEETLLPIITDWLEKGYYLISRVDVSKLPGTQYYQGKPVAHTVVFYGYDLRKKTFKHLDFKKNGDLAPIEVSFNDYHQAFFSEELQKLLKEKNIQSKFHITICSIKSSISYQLDLDSIKSLLNDYLYCVNTTKKYNLFIPEAKGVYGLDIYEALISSMVQQPEKLDYRAFHALYEHKKIMVYRLKYLEKHNLIDQACEFSRKFANIERMTQLIRHSVLKFVMIKDTKIMDEVKYLLKTIHDQEKTIIQEILTKL